MGFFVLDGKCSEDFGIGLSGTLTWPTPEREIETAKVPGRNGSLITYVGSWKNVEITYPAWISRRFNSKFDAFAEWWNAHTDNYYELTDTYHPGYFRLARPVSKLEPSVGTINRSGRFDLKFDCMPQKFLRDGNVPRTIPDSRVITLRNPTQYDAYPLVAAKIRNHSPNAIQIIGDMDTLYSRVDFAAEDAIYDYNDRDIIFDSETHESTCFFPGGVRCANAAVSETYENDMKAFYIPAGETVTIESWVGEFEFYPRWYTI